LHRGNTIGLAFGLSGFIAGAAVAGMIALVRTPPAKEGLIIAEPAAVNLSPFGTIPTATLISLEGEPSRKTPFSRLALTSPMTMLEYEGPDPDEALDPRAVAEADLATHSAVPLPRRRPSPEELKLALARNLPPVAKTGDWSRQAVEEARAKCEQKLKGLDVEFKIKDSVGRPKGCGLAYPLSVSEIAGVAITPAATLNCEMTAALHGWITQVVQPTAREEFNTRLTGLQNASSYACRLRNNSSSGKLSEHALGNALDIADFRFSNRMEASVGGGWSGSIKGLSLASRGGFMKRTRSGACKYFNTVLGPGSDAHHKDHYHLDLMKLRPGRGKYCR
jgi:hypothetical protein